MSNAGQAVLSVVGAVVGYYLGGATGAYYGFQLGYLAGSFLFPTQLDPVAGPRLGDGQQTSSTVGDPIPWIFGTQTVGGNIIWASPIREVATSDTQGKGSSEQTVTTYTYYRSWAILLCEGPIAGVRRIWANGKIVYDRSPPTITNPDYDSYYGYGEYLTSLVSQVVANADYEGKVTVYLGDEDQLPDPTIESFEGVGNVPANRGYAYIVFDDVKLKSEDGNRIPATWKFEVYNDGTEGSQDVVEYSNDVIYDWVPLADTLSDPRNLYNVHKYKAWGTSHLGFDQPNGIFPHGAPVRDQLGESMQDAAEAVQDAQNLSALPNFGGAWVLGWAISLQSNDASTAVMPYSQSPQATVLDNKHKVVRLHMQTLVGNSVAGFHGYHAFDIPTPAPGITNCDWLYQAGFLGSEQGAPDFLWWNGEYVGGDPETVGISGSGGYYWWDYYQNRRFEEREILINNCIFLEWPAGDTPGLLPYGQLMMLPDVLVDVWRVTQPPPDPADVGIATGVEDWYVYDGRILQGGPWTRDDAHTYRALQAYTESGLPTMITYPLNPILPLGHPSYDSQTFWEEAYAREVARGRMASGLTYGVDYPKTQNYGYYKLANLSTVDTRPVSLATVVAAICEREGTLDYDVSDLADIFIIGYQISRPMSGRSAIEPLRSVGFFDVVESGSTLKFVTRGKGIVHSYDAGELGARVASDSRPAAITTTKQQEFELPRQVRVHFQDPDADFDPGEELSPARFDTRATTITDVDIGCAVTSDDAAKIAEVLMRDFWTSRWSYQTQVDVSTAFIEDADAVEVPVDGFNQRMRVVAHTENLPNLRALELVRDDDGTYVSQAAGSGRGRTPARISFYGPVLSDLLDLPALLDANNDAGFYADAYPAITGGLFRGAVITRSVDGGGSYSSVAALTNATTAGTLQNAAPIADAEVFDQSTEFTIELDYGSLASATRDEVLDGANAAAIGGHGRWEVIQFTTATHVTGRVWTVSGLLRGRRGTEWAIGQAVAGDRFVLLTTSTLVRVPLENTAIGVSRLYKSVPPGTIADAVAPVAFTGNAVALKPFSPVHLRVSVGSGSPSILTATWIRRGRFGKTLTDGADVALSEESESYDVELRNSADVLVASATVSAQQWSPDVTLDGNEYTLTVWQRSAIVGRGYPGSFTFTSAPEAGEVPGTPSTPDYPEDSILLPLVYDEEDLATAYTWTRNGDGPRITERGMLGDGYQSRITTPAPSWATSAADVLTIRANVAPYFGGSRNATRDTVVYVGTDDLSAHAKLEIAVVSDDLYSGEAQVAAQSYTGSIQSERLCRRLWRYRFASPQPSFNGYGGRPQAVFCESSTSVLFTQHFQDTLSRCFRVALPDGSISASFDFPLPYVHVASVAQREDGTFWFAEYATGKILRVDLDASFSSGTATSDLAFTIFGASKLSAIEWVNYSGNEYLLAADYQTGSGAYLYVIDPAQVVDGATFNTASRVKRLVMPLFVQGIVHSSGLLYVSASNSGGQIFTIDFASWLQSGADGDSYTTYLTATVAGPSEQVEDLSIDAEGKLWTLTEGRGSAGDNVGWLAAHSSDLTTPVANNYTLEYDGAGTVTIKVNDFTLATKSWTPTPAPAVVSIGGPPQAVDGQTAGFFVGQVSDVVVQDEAMRFSDHAESVGATWPAVLPLRAPLPLTNAGAESGDTSGWTNETGSLAVRNSNPVAFEGENYFYGGAVAATVARQRIDMSTLGISLDDLDTLPSWCVVEWAGATFATQADTHAVGLRFLAADQSTILESYAAEYAPNVAGSWVQRNYGLSIPTGTRYIDVLLKMDRLSGTNNDGYVDQVRASIYIKGSI